MGGRESQGCRWGGGQGLVLSSARGRVTWAGPFRPRGPTPAPAESGACPTQPTRAHLCLQETFPFQSLVPSEAHPTLSLSGRFSGARFPHRERGRSSSQRDNSRIRNKAFRV